jgi:hypothetical protein
MSLRSRFPSRSQDSGSEPDFPGPGIGTGPGTGSGRDRRPWFGPKRFGVGYRPQTWQGYTVAGGLVVLATVLVKTAHGPSARFLAVAIPLAVVVVIRVLAGRR